MKSSRAEGLIWKGTPCCCIGKALDTQELWGALREEGEGYPEVEWIWFMMWGYNLYLLPTPLSLSGILLLGLKLSTVLSPGLTPSLG